LREAFFETIVSTAGEQGSGAAGSSTTSKGATGASSDGSDSIDFSATVNGADDCAPLSGAASSGPTKRKTHTATNTATSAMPQPISHLPKSVRPVVILSTLRFLRLFAANFSRKSSCPSSSRHFLQLFFDRQDAKNQRLLFFAVNSFSNLTNHSPYLRFLCPLWLKTLSCILWLRLLHPSVSFSSTAF
jgi:hypothetical protein